MKEKALLIIITMVLVAVFVTGVWRLTSDGFSEWTIRIYQSRIEFEDIISLIGIYASIIDNYNYIEWQNFHYISSNTGNSKIIMKNITATESVTIWEGQLRDDSGLQGITKAFTHTILPIDSAVWSYLGGTITTVGLITGKIGTILMRVTNATMWLLGFT